MTTAPHLTTLTNPAQGCREADTLKDATNHDTPQNLGNLTPLRDEQTPETALAGTAPVTGYLDFELHTDGGIFIPAHTAQGITRTSLSFTALATHRAALEAPTTTTEESDYYQQHTLTPDEVPDNITCELTHDQDTNTASADITISKPMYLTGEPLTEFLKTLHQVLGEMEHLESDQRPVNIARHLLEAATVIEAHSFTETAGEASRGIPVAAHLFAQYLVIFSAREYESDYTPVEYLEDALIHDEDYEALEAAGLIVPMVDAATGALASYLLPLFAGE